MAFCISIISRGVLGSLSTQSLWCYYFFLSSKDVPEMWRYLPVALTCMYAVSLLFKQFPISLLLLGLFGYCNKLYSTENIWGWEGLGSICEVLLQISKIPSPSITILWLQRTRYTREKHQGISGNPRGDVRNVMIRTYRRQLLRESRALFAWKWMISEFMGSHMFGRTKIKFLY